MLRKLLKYEFKNTYKVVLLLLGAVALATLVGFIALQSPFWDDLSGTSYYVDNFIADLLSMMSFFSITFYIIMLVGVVYAALIYLVVRFYRTMYTDEGYLLHTLPVTKHQILISKIFVSSVWMYLIYFAMYASLAFFILSLVNVFTSDSVWLSMPSYLATFQEFMGEFIDLFGGGWLVSYLVLAVLGVPAAIITFFGAVSMGQLFAKHRVLMAIVSYIVILIASSMVRSIFQGSLALTSASFIQTGEDFGHYMMVFANSQMITSLLIAAGCYIASYYITSRNLNLD